MRRLMGWLLGKAPLGQGQGGGVGHQADFAAPPYYLVRDEFTSDRAAGAVLGTPAEPSGWPRQGVDSGNYLSITGGALAISGGGSTWGTSVLYGVLVGRVPGQVMVAEITLGNKLFAVVGFSSSSIGLGSSTDNLQIYFRDVLRFWGGGIGYNYGAYNTATSYVVAAVLRASGGFLFIRNYGGDYWMLIEIFSVGTASADPQINSFNAALTSSYFRVPAALWMPTPLVSDGFSAWGTSDGLGHAEGSAGGIGSGGGGVAWTAAAGTWGAAAGVASASALAGGVAIATAASGKADVIVTVNLTRAAGTVGLVLRYADASNYVYARHTGTQVTLRKVVAGVDSQVLALTNATYAAGAPLRVVASGSAFRVYYNNAAIGAEQTISDAAVQSPTAHGLYTTDTGNTFDDLTVYARGTGGEYDTILDAI